MSYFILHRDNEFIGVTPFKEWCSLPEVSIVEVEGDVPNLNHVIWNSETLTLEKTKSLLSRIDFLSRFTISERIAIRSSPDPIAFDAMNLLSNAEVIDVEDQRTMMAVGYLAMTGLIENNRVAEVLA